MSYFRQIWVFLVNFFANFFHKVSLKIYNHEKKSFKAKIKKKNRVFRKTSKMVIFFVIKALVKTDPHKLEVPAWGRQE
jgi:hypothetical protein